MCSAPSADRVKLLVWDGSGLTLIYKRLDEGRFVTLADVVAALAKAEREGRLHDKIRFLCRASLLIVDEIGYLPVVPDAGSLFF